MSTVMYHSIRNLTHALVRLIFGAVLLAPLAASAADMAMPQHRTVMGTSAAAADNPAPDECCDHAKKNIPPCEDQSACITKCAGPHGAFSAGQGTYTDFSRSYWRAVPESLQQPSAKPVRLGAAGPPLSILFCSFQI